MGLQRTPLRLAELASPTRALKEASERLPLLHALPHNELVYRLQTLTRSMPKLSIGSSANSALTHVLNFPSIQAYTR